MGDCIISIKIFWRWVLLSLSGGWNYFVQNSIDIVRRIIRYSIIRYSIIRYPIIRYSVLQMFRKVPDILLLRFLTARTSCFAVHGTTLLLLLLILETSGLMPLGTFLLFTFFQQFVFDCFGLIVWLISHLISHFPLFSLAVNWSLKDLLVGI